jgi:hypothetical protein
MAQNDYDELDHSKEPCQHKDTMLDALDIKAFSQDDYILVAGLEECTFCGASREVDIRYSIIEDKVIIQSEWDGGEDAGE